ncbi:MAG: hypothetical protein ACFFDP_03955 [Promethearchaeota archaeon]
MPTSSSQVQTKSTYTYPITNSNPFNRLFQNLTEGNADIGTIVIGEDGSLSATFLSAGNEIGEFAASAPEYEYCLMALAMFRWGDYEGLTENLLAFLGGESESEVSGLLDFLNLLPLSSILMVFFGGDASQIQVWGAMIAEDFETTLDMPFSRVTGIPPLTVENMTFSVEAYGYDGTDIEARNDFQEYMATLGSTRRGMSELVTPELAEKCNGSIGVCGVINIGAMSGTPPAKAPIQGNETLIFSSWSSTHMDQFFGREEQVFDLNVFCDRTGTISMHNLDALDFNILLPAGTNVTDYYPDDMTNSSSPENVEVSRSTSTWEAVPEVPTINVTFQGHFPPGLKFTKTITPRISPGATATVTLQVKNIDTNQTIYNIHVDDSHSWNLYAGTGAELITIVGQTTADWDILLPGESETLIYYVTISVEGLYLPIRANVTYQDETLESFEKQSNKANVLVYYANIIEFLLTLFNDIPWSIPVILIVGLMILYLIVAAIKSLRRKKQPRLQPAPTFTKGFEESSFEEPTLPPSAHTPAPAPKTSDGEVCVNCGGLIPPGVLYCPACGARVASEY